MNTLPIIYEELQYIINECLSLGRKPFDGFSDLIVVNSKRCSTYDTEVCFIAPTEGDTFYKKQYYDKWFSYHELFSKDSGLMEFVDWDIKDVSFKNFNKQLCFIAYINMAHLRSTEKVKYFINNAIVPKKKIDRL